jgi:4,5-DOPA dioxygenase extradiol
LYYKDYQDTFSTQTMKAHTHTLPALFLGHGSPTYSFEDNAFTRALQKYGKSLPTPEAIVCVSAHWRTLGTRVTSTPLPPTLHDFYGFPDEFYQFYYPAPGSPALAKRIEKLGEGRIHGDLEWGLDHGTWAVLRHLFPKGTIPTLQLSLDKNLKPREHYELAKRLAPLRDEGVLVMGSGNIVHNLRGYREGFDDPPKRYAAEFDERVKQCILSGDHDSLIDYGQLSPHAALAVPTDEHYLPLLYMLALQRPSEPVSFFYEAIHNSVLAMRCLRVG